ncbi:MAG TPA: type IV secretory system conjugative DNA transfer family protein, partial [Kribbellaceae bacterium]|nr:type IV secretory system conjugative DNA transfer family protein [Kribbellaceae bacterium]
WRRRVLAAIITGGGWLAIVTAHGLTWTNTGGLLLLELLLASRWWQACRLGHPSGRPQSPLPKPVNADTGPDRDNIPGLWDAYIGNKDGALAGSYLHSRIVDDHRESYTVELVPGKHSLDKALSSLDRIQSGLRRPQQEIIVEPHPSGDSAQLQLTIVTKSPIKDTVPFDGPKYVRVGYDSWIEPGGYADGEGRVRVSLYAANSARHMVVFGGQGSGKTALLNQMAVSARASGHTVIWYLDGQGGASSPQLMKYADWAPTGPTAANDMLAALKRVFAVRGLIMKVNRLAGLSPSAGLPGLVVIIDECHLVFDTDRPAEVKEWTDLAAIARKLCVAFWAATQHPELASFGGKDKLRALLMQYTTLVLRTTSGVANNILRLQVDPSKLPTLPGYGYVVAGDKAEGVRSAPFRADFLDDSDGQADAWFEACPGVALDSASAHAAGSQYTDRVAIAERLAREDEAVLEHLMNGNDVPELDDAVSTTTSPVTGSLELAEVTAFPAPLVAVTDHLEPHAPDGLSASQAAIWTVVAQGAEKATEIAFAAGLSTSQTYKLLAELVDAGHLMKAAHGRYGTADDQDRGGVHR